MVYIVLALLSYSPNVLNTVSVIVKAERERERLNIYLVSMGQSIAEGMIMREQSRSQHTAHPGGRIMPPPPSGATPHLCVAQPHLSMS